jgi:DNA-directed RNA polymerase subunit RPC12/RpoP
MNAPEAAHGLACPQCGGVVPVPEGQVIVACPYCDLRSLVKGERGLQRYQVPQKVAREGALEAMQRFLSGKKAIASNAARQATLEEAFIAYLPFWVNWARALGWVFGQKRVGSGDNTRYEPREVRTAQDLSWNGAACDVGEFGVTVISLQGRALEPFDPQRLHEAGLVFEPVGSLSEARTAAGNDFQERLRRAAGLDRVSQVFTRMVRARMGLVYYPLWVLRYLYRGRAFQVVVDGYSGDVLYGKAPGSTLYRAAVLVGGMALGALLAVDGSALAFYLGSQADGDSASALFVGGIVALVAGFGLMAGAYRAFRFGEQYEYRQGGKGAFSLQQSKQILEQIEGLTRWTDR